MDGPLDGDRNRSRLGVCDPSVCPWNAARPVNGHTETLPNLRHSNIYPTIRDHPRFPHFVPEGPLKIAQHCSWVGGHRKVYQSRRNDRDASFRPDRHARSAVRDFSTFHQRDSQHESAGLGFVLERLIAANSGRKRRTSARQFALRRSSKTKPSVERPSGAKGYLTQSAPLHPFRRRAPLRGCPFARPTRHRKNRSIARDVAWHSDRIAPMISGQFLTVVSVARTPPLQSPWEPA